MAVFTCAQASRALDDLIADVNFGHSTVNH